ncbi:MAG TPA: SDR family NAD(P)-dependent oxidoreductase [Streptosporangiales bacterium]
MAGAVVVGAGPLIGTSVARRFAKEGMPVTVIARSPATVDAAVRAVGGTAAFGLTADVTDEEAIRSALDRSVAANGVPDVVVYNAAVIRADRLGELSAAELAGTLAVNVIGGVTVGAHVAPTMVDAGGGSLLFTGGMPGVKAEYASLSLGKAALRTVADLFRAAYGDRGLHVATVTVHDAVVPGTPYDPDLIAEEFAALHHEPVGRWRHEVAFRR